MLHFKLSMEQLKQLFAMAYRQNLYTQVSEGLYLPFKIESYLGSRREIVTSSESFHFLQCRWQEMKQSSCEVFPFMSSNYVVLLLIGRSKQEPQHPQRSQELICKSYTWSQTSRTAVRQLVQVQKRYYINWNFRNLD